MTEGPHEIAIRIAKMEHARTLNEADTRHKIIDEILHGVLGWPVNQTLHESFISPGFADYRLKRSNGDDLIFIEAKKEGIYFNIPHNFNSDQPFQYITIQTLLTDTNIRTAIEQVRTYCMEEGCNFAGITNGHEWILFKTFETGKNWRNLKALTIKSNRYFSEKFTEAVNILSYSAIKEGSLKSALGGMVRKNREIFYPKDKIASYDHEVSSNGYARELRPLANKYFGTIDVSEPEFMESCYVSQRDYETAFTNFRLLIKDSLTPYLEERGIQQAEDNGKGGIFGNRIAKSLKEKKQGEVIVLFGGKGAGKSTFLRKLLYHNPPQYLSKYSRVAIADLLNTPEDEKQIFDKIWGQVISNLDVDEILKSDREKLLELFSDKFDLAKKQTLCGLNETSEAYNLELNKMIRNWLDDKKYVAKKLVGYWKIKHKGCVIAIDNTDQLPHSLQDFCFTTAQEIADQLGCLVIISMREERFHASRIHGTLDAYQNSGFHISSPVAQAVFEKRINYVQSMLERDDFCDEFFGEKEKEHKIDVFKKLFRIFQNEFRQGNNSPLNDFLSACAHGNIRLALELFRDFLKSGYTSVDEMVSSKTIWKLKIHQVLKPLMIPYRFFYEESQSSIPNLFQIRSKSNGSHFTGMRILHKLSDGIDPSNPFYVSISEFKDYFSENFNMIEDLEKNLDIFLKLDLVESNNRLDFYCDAVDSIKITTYGLYIFNILSSFFTYIELISTDCGIFNEAKAHEMVSLSNEDFRLFTARKRLERVRTRISKAEAFISYLEKEEEQELEYFGAHLPKFTQKIRESFDIEKEEVLRSAQRPRNRT
ncbi:hypothetical protein [Pseudomonas denitrificans (nom. rej.)]|uniref:Uncharacterized protein n=1 Tax=Pseudomonas denitrificans TaxID=43306 RepID=A0A9X7R3N6_PSEDE|nr:hypothetical protein [Pseudomonas denitrificans (nom. rej.)]QEY71498.1 hypothetical protein F1C79_07590 [Pseudomonas denitrificans (nom. rej.)]